MLTDAELDALLANAKPYHAPKFGQWRWYIEVDVDEDDRDGVIPRQIFDRIRTGQLMGTSWYKFATETAAMDALREAIEQYKQARDAK